MLQGFLMLTSDSKVKVQIREKDTEEWQMYMFWGS